MILIYKKMLVYSQDDDDDDGDDADDHNDDGVPYYNPSCTNMYGIHFFIIQLQLYSLKC